MSAIGTWDYKSGTSDTATLPVNAIVTQLRAGSRSDSGTIVIFGGSSIPVRGDAAGPNPTIFEMTFQNDDGPVVAKPGALDITFTNTTSYFVGYIAR